MLALKLEPVHPSDELFALGLGLWLCLDCEWSVASQSTRSVLNQCGSRPISCATHVTLVFTFSAQGACSLFCIVALITDAKSHALAYNGRSAGRATLSWLRHRALQPVRRQRTKHFRCPSTIELCVLSHRCSRFPRRAQIAGVR
jgi:hypothetical protein